MILRRIILTIVLLKIVTTSCKQQGSLSFVIDNTFSMQQEIDQVKQATDRIMDIVLNKPSSQIEDIVLVTFNDPASYTQLRQKTRDRYQLKKALYDIQVFGGGDCPEYSMTGIKMALENSLPNSYLFVFTDASPKDYHLLPKIKRLAQNQASQIIFIITPAPEYCRHDISTNFRYYYDITASTFGQVFMCDNKEQVEKILHYVDAVVSGDKTVIVNLEIPSNKLTYIPFTIDDQTEYAIVSATGTEVELKLVQGPNLNFEKITWVTNAKVMKLVNPEPGSYKVSVKGSSSTSVMIFGRTDFTFQHGFSEVEMAKFNDDIKKPIDGTKYHLLIKVNDPAKSVNIQFAEILTKDRKLIKRLDLLRKGENYYVTPMFIPPTSEFLIQITGQGRKTGKTIKRAAKTPIETRPRNSDPEITLDKLGSEEYNSTLQLFCHVKAHPQPTVTWKYGNGKVIASGVTESLTRYNYINKLVINRLTNSETYFCYAENDVGESSKRIEVTVKPPFTFDNAGNNSVTYVDLGETAVLHCPVKSNFSIQLSWYYLPESGDYKLISNSDKYSLLNKQTELHIKKVNRGDERKYMCKAWLPSDADINKRIFQQVSLNAVAPILGKHTNISVIENKSAILKCDVIKAHPPPRITWQFKSYNSAKYQTLPETKDQLKISSVNLDNSGTYKCIATNVKGSGEMQTELIVLIAPKINILVNNVKASSTRVKYNSTVLLTCVVASHSKPKIFWMNSKGKTISENSKHLKPMVYESQLTVENLVLPETFYCVADNDFNENLKEVTVDVNSPFQLNSSESEIIVEYGAQVTVECKITSHSPIKIVWYRINGQNQTEVIKQSNNYSISDDGIKLNIKRIDVDQQGKYKCQARLVHDETVNIDQTTTITITGLERPMIDQSESSIKSQNDSKAILKCKILRGHPKPSISWLIKYVGSDELLSLDEPREILTIDNLRYEDTGMYKCIAQNAVGKDEKVIELIVEGPPKIISDEDILYSAVEGDVVLRIPCITVGYPKPVLQWFKQDSREPLDLKGTKYNLKEEHLIINKPMKEDSSNYTCKAGNTLGKDIKTFETIVTENIELDDDYGNFSYIYILEGAEEKLECNTGTESGRWFKEWLPTNVTGTLTIKEATTLNDGNYTCRVSDKLGSKSHTYLLDVGYPPTFKAGDENKEIKWDGSSEKLDCTVQMKPDSRTVKIQWLYNGKLSNIKSQLHPLIGFGNYSCLIGNYHGNVTKTFAVTSDSCLIKRNTDIANSPLILSTSGTWPKLVAEDDYFSVPQKKQLIFSCHNQTERTNTFENLPKEDQIIATCESSDKFSVKDKIYTYSELKCGSKVMPEIVKTGIKCANDESEMIKVGFNTGPTKAKFVEVYSVCFDKLRKLPIYTQTTLRRPINTRPVHNEKFSTVKEYYNENNKEFCAQDTECCLTKSQLVNAMDVREGPSQVATFIDNLNTVPLWQDCVNNVSWSQVEQKLRFRLGVYNEFVMWSGANEYVYYNDLAIPRYLWKVVKLTSEATYAIVRVNDPAPSKDDILCTTNCPSWLKNDRFTYCCSLDEIQQLFLDHENITLI